MFCGCWTSYDASQQFECSFFEGGRRPCSEVAGPRSTNFNNSNVHPSKEVEGLVLWSLDFV